MKKVMLVSAAAAAFFAAPVIAQDQMPSVEQIMGFLDADKSGFIEKSEVQGPMVEFFDMIDADKDTKVSATELQTAMDMRAKAIGAKDAAAPADRPAGE